MKIKVKSAEFLTVMGIWLALWAAGSMPLPYDIDSVNFALALVDRFDPSFLTDQPQTPGYFFHVLFGKALHTVIKNPFTVQQVQSLAYLLVFLFLCASVAEQKGALLLSGSMPLLMYFAPISAIHAALVCWSAAICLELYALRDRRLSPVFLMATLAAASGFRQDLLLYLGPVVLYDLILSQPSLRQWVKGLLAFFLITLLWLVPTWMAADHAPFVAVGKAIAWFIKPTAVVSGANTFNAIRYTIMSFMFLLGAAGPGGVAYFFLKARGLERSQAIMLMLGILPNILFLLFIHGPGPGYFGSSLGFFMIWALIVNKHELKPALLIMLASFNIVFFLSAPSPQLERNSNFHDRSIVQNIGKQLRYTGGSGWKRIVDRKKELVFLDTTIGRCSCFYDRDVQSAENLANSISIPAYRMHSYLALYQWNNKFITSKDSCCCSTGKAAPGESPDLVFDGLGVWLPGREHPGWQETCGGDPAEE
ncbi:hypothetical protein ACFL5V_04690 [Fibrobacterota bacterium]